MGEEEEDGVVGGVRGVVRGHVGFDECAPGGLPLGDGDHFLGDVDPPQVHAGVEEGRGGWVAGAAAQVEDFGSGGEERGEAVQVGEKGGVLAVLVLVGDVDGVEEGFGCDGGHGLFEGGVFVLKLIFGVRFWF